ncbi:MAG: nuclear transport factor 2 family protein, partial [Acidimicrobiia bacterium]|nr:nuclear transport factor 2 family protein [Acidimicrobiia bacterium]
MGLTLDDLLAKEEIREVLFRYCRGIDRLDFDLVESCYHPGAYDDHGTYQGDVPGFITMCKGFLPRFVCTQHFLGNML